VLDNLSINAALLMPTHNAVFGRSQSLCNVPSAAMAPAFARDKTVQWNSSTQRSAIS